MELNPTTTRAPWRHRAANAIVIAAVAAIMALAVTAAALVGRAALTDHDGTAPRCGDPVTDSNVLDTWTAANIDALIRRCDYRATTGTRPCPEDAWCAVAVVDDTGNFPGYDATR